MAPERLLQPRPRTSLVSVQRAGLTSDTGLATAQPLRLGRCVTVRSWESPWWLSNMTDVCGLDKVSGALETEGLSHMSPRRAAGDKCPSGISGSATWVELGKPREGKGVFLQRPLSKRATVLVTRERLRTSLLPQETLSSCHSP